MKPAIARARELRKNSTDAERLLWQHLRLRQINGDRFRRQRPVGRYILDFVCLEKRVAVEIDGGQHSEAVSYDRQRDEWLRKQGFVVLRFWNDEVLTQIEGVKEVIWKALKETPPWSSPARGGGKEIMLPATGAVIFDIWSLVTYESHLKSRRSRRHLGIRQ
jgi:very-short-patch-repair endonuclease